LLNFAKGTYVDPKDKIVYYFNLFKNQITIQNNTIHIRLAGDSTNIGKNISVLNFSFGFLDKIKFENNEQQSLTTNPNAVTGNFSLGVFLIKSESYDEIKESLAEILDHMELH